MSIVGEVDVAIIGGGVVGLSIAEELSTRSKLTVALFDKGGLGHGTSGRSAGVICRHDQGPIYQRLSLIGHQRMLDLAAQQSLTFNRWGNLNVVREPAEFPPRRPSMSQFDLVPSRMYDEELLERDELLERFPWLEPTGVRGAVFEPNIGFINPHELLALYRRLLAERPTVHVDFGNPVLAADRTRDGSIDAVITRRGSWRARTVVNASGAWAPKIAALAGTTVAITPQRMNVAVAVNRASATDELPLHGVPGASWRSDGVWCRGETGGGALIGQHRDLTRADEPASDPDHFDGLPDRGFVDMLKPIFEARYELPHMSLTDGWTCVYDTSPDGHPVIGRDPEVPNLLHAVGMNGHGMTIHPGVARCIAALILERTSVIDISDVMGRPEMLDFSPLVPSRFAEGRRLPLGIVEGDHAAADTQSL